MTKTTITCLKGRKDQKAIFYWNAKIIWSKYQKQSIKNKIIIKNNKKKVIVGANLSRKKKEKKGEFYNSYHELLSHKYIIKRSRFHVSYIISPLPVAILATFHLACCIEY